MASTNVSNSNNTNQNQQPLDTNTAAAILSQFDQNTQLQALAMLRQLNAQQQLQQMHQLQQLQQLQALQKMALKMPLDNNAGGTTSPTNVPSINAAMQNLSVQENSTESTNHVVNNNTKRVISSATRPPKMSITANSYCTSGHGQSTNFASNITSSCHNSSNFNNTNYSNIKISTSNVPMQNKYDLPSNNTAFQPIVKEIGPDGETFIVPTDDMADQIIIASEYYFSDENLAKDHYLLRQICQKSEGFLSVKLLTALKNVKRLTKDWRVTSYALKKSTRLQLNAELTKVKRVAVLPDQVLKARQITNVIAIRIPMEFSSVSSITQLFAQFGKITLVRVLLPGRQVPCDLRNYATQVPDMGNSLCAVVEYETETEACTACRELNSKRYSSGLRSALLGPRLRRNLYKALPEGQEEEINNNTTVNTLANSSNLSTTNNAWNKAVVIDGKSEKVDSAKGTSINSTNSSGKVRDSGCDTASSHSSSSPPTARKNNLKEDGSFDRAPGAHRKSVKMQINISNNSVSVLRQPKGPQTGSGFSFCRITPSNMMITT